MRVTFLSAFIAVFLVSAADDTANASSDGDDNELAKFAALIKDAETMLRINADPVQRAIVCRLGFQRFSIGAIARATGLSKSRLMEAARGLMNMGRLDDRSEISTDGLSAYIEAVEGAFDGDVDFAQLIKLYTESTDKKGSERKYSAGECCGTRRRIIEGNPDKRDISTSYVEHQNLSMRLGMHRFTRLTNAFSKKTEKLVPALHLYFVHYNFCRIHKTLRVTPAMEAGIDDKVRDYAWIVGLIDANTPAPKKPGPAVETIYKNTSVPTLLTRVV